MVSNRPIRHLRVTTDDTGLLLDPSTILADLGQLPPALMTEEGNSSQYLTVYLDWRPHETAPGTRPARRYFDDQAKSLLEGFADHSEAKNSLTTDLERVGRWLDGERVDRHMEVEPLTNAAQGVVIVSRSTDDLFVTIPLGVPVKNHVSVGPIPSLTTLMRISEDYSPYAVLVADQVSASLSFIGQGRVIQEVEAGGATYPLRRQAGGSQRRYQARAGERLDQFARAIADGVRQLLEGSGIKVLVVVGDEVMTSPLNQFLHESVSDSVIASVRGTMQMTNTELVELTMPYAMAAERERESALVGQITRRLGQADRAASGAETVMAALQNRQVSDLALVDDLHQTGWADYSARIVGVGPMPENHPTDGSMRNLVPVAVEDELVRRALNSGAEIEIVHSSVPVDLVTPDMSQHSQRRTDAATELDKLGGAAALLRFN